MSTYETCDCYRVYRMDIGGDSAHGKSKDMSLLYTHNSNFF